MKKFLSLVLALVMTMSLVTISAGAKTFEDDAAIDYTEAVEVMKAVKVIDGYADGNFNPTNTLTRGAAAKIICNLILGPTTADALKADVAPYSDVPVSNVFSGYIAYCQKEGIISGYADGTFRPAATLTGYAFWKMLLGALGYDASIEGYTGANWSINVAKRGLSSDCKLSKGLNNDFDGTKPVTREEACLYAFNMIKAGIASYGTTTTVDVNGATVTVGGSKVSISSQKYYEKYFKDLKANDVADSMGHPATQWKIKNKEVGVYSKEADATFTANTKLYTVRDELGLTTSSDTPSFYYVTNGHSGANEESVDNSVRVPLNYYTSTSNVKLADLASVGEYAGNGVTFEFFYDDDDKDAALIVVTDEYFGKVTSIDEDDDGRFAYISAKSDNATVDVKAYSDTLNKGDYVLYTCGEGVNDDGTKAPKTLEVVTPISGTVTRIDGSKYTVGGTVYQLHKGVDDLKSASIDDEFDLYLDSNGYVIYAELTASSASLDNLAIVTDKAPSAFNTAGKLIYANGKTEEVTLKDSNTTLNKVYKVTTDSGKIKVSAASDYTSTYYAADAYRFTKGSTKIVDGSSNTVANVNSKTTFVYIDSDGDTTVYTGVKAAPSITAGTSAIVVYVKNDSDYAKVVFVYTAGATTENKDSVATYAIWDDYSDVTTKIDGDEVTYYEVKTVGGSDLKIEKTAFDSTVEHYATSGICVLDSISTNSKGIVTSATVKTDKVTVGAIGSSTKVEVSDGIFSIKDMAFADNVTVYILDKDDPTYRTVDLDAVNENAGKYNGYTVIQNSDLYITTLILREA